ncbi:MAG: hypothetical protein M3Y13_10150 [Armatimonadota bacterium]|nr:hypothetical protein [Armatimonadota bacterium]
MKRQNWIPAALAAAALTAWGPRLRAQDATTTTTTTDTTTTTGAMTTGNTGAGLGMGADMLDYSLINNPLYDYMDLKAAAARGYSDSQIATILKIARLSDQPFRLILQKVEVGDTFAMLASEYNLRLDDIMDVTDDQARIATYLATYESLGSMGRARYGMMSSTSTGPDTELDRMIAQWNQEYAAFPSTDFAHLNPIPSHAGEVTTTTTTTDTTTTTTVVAPPPTPAPVETTETTTQTATPVVHYAPVRQVRHHRARHIRRPVHHRRVRRHRRLPVYMYRGS